MLAAIANSSSKSRESNRFPISLLLIIVVGSCAFAGLAVEVKLGVTQKLDESVILALRRPGDPAVIRGPFWFQDLCRDLTALGGYAFLFILVTLVVAFLSLDRKTRALWFLVGAVVGGYLVSMGLKALIARPRPTLVPYLSQAYNSSFPSGHAMMSAVVYLTLGALLSRFARNLPRMRVFFLVVSLALTGLVGASRVYMGVHYPTDVLAGWTAGLVWASMCSLVAQRLQRRGMVDTEL